MLIRRTRLWKRLQVLRYTLFPLPLRLVAIETTSFCNRRCAYCPNTTVGRPVGWMPIPVFGRIIDSLAELGFSGELNPHGYGEPLADARLPELIR